MSITEFFLRRRAVLWFLLALFVVGGVWAFTQMGKKEDSTFVIKTAVVICPYAGATPYEVEQLVSEPVARELQSVRRVKKVTSESYYGLSKIMVELESGTRSDEIPQLWDELRRKAMNIASQLPEGAGPIQVNDDFGDVYGLYFALAADDGFEWDEIRDWAQRVKTEVVTIDGVQKVALQGEQQAVVNIYLTRSVLANFSITPEMIISAIAQQNSIVSTGEIAAGQMRVRILEPGVYSTIDDVANQLLIASDGRQFRLGDVARIEQEYSTEPSVIVRVDGRRAVGVGVSTEAEADVVSLGGEVSEVLQRLQAQMPVGMEVVTLYPEDQIAREANFSFMLNLLESVAIVIVIIMLAMGRRSGVLIGLSLIFTIGGTMLLMYAVGEGINRTSLAGFIIAMGMLVDNAIVVVDNAEKARLRGVPLGEALVEAADGPKWALLGATLIAVFSFLPLYLAPSSVAEIVKPLFVVVALSLLLSWALALSQVPMFGLFMLKNGAAESGESRAAVFDRLLGWALGHRWTVVAMAVVMFVGSMVAMRMMPQNFFPKLDKPYFRADVILPEGYDIFATEQRLERMSEWLLGQPEVERVSSTAGSTPLRYYLASGSVSLRPNFGNLLVEVDSDRATERVKSRFDEYVAQEYPDVWLRSSLFKLSPVPDATIEIGFVGNDVDTLLRLTHQVEQIMREIPEADNVRNSWGNRIPTWLPVYSQTKGQRIGVGRSSMAQWITLATEGFRMGTFRRGDEHIPILLKDEDFGHYNLSNLQSMPIFSQSGEVYSLEQASSRFDFDYRTGVVKQLNRRRVVKAQCDPRVGVNTGRLFERILGEVERRVVVPEGYELKIFGEQESQQESNEALGEYMPLTLVLIFVVLLLLFNNFRDPVIVLLMLPLIFIGVVAGLLVTANQFDFFSLLGLLGLVGMNVKNAVILVSTIDEERAAGATPYDAICRAARGRLVPVSVASGTTILALVPLLFDSLFASMAATIMGGLMVATVLTMVVLPVVYALFYGIKPSIE
ncbi:MAG: efflux RND transporter permease subunit [Rikenellaceae bacterium]|nr:efflux RND transporter permease subunit [Rikenellaceae bacterium]